MNSPPEPRELREALRGAVSALKEHGPPFALAGSYALWAYGAPEPTHDVDIVVAEADVPAAATTLGKAGFRIERPPEDWLFKAHFGETVVDVLHRGRAPSGNSWTGSHRRRNGGQRFRGGVPGVGRTAGPHRVNPANAGISQHHGPATESWTPP